MTANELCLETIEARLSDLGLLEWQRSIVTTVVSKCAGVASDYLNNSDDQATAYRALAISFEELARLARAGAVQHDPALAGMKLVGEFENDQASALRAAVRRRLQPADVDLNTPASIDGLLTD